MPENLIASNLSDYADPQFRRAFFQVLPVLENTEIAPNNFLIEIESKEISYICKAGQFAMLKPHRGVNTLLGRPYSIFRKNGDRLAFLYKVYGLGSKNISELKKGEYLDIWGPLGNGFFPAPAKHWIFIAGGIGIAPFLYLAQTAPHGTRMTLFFGIKTRDQAVLEEDFSRLNCKVIWVTEDGSLGEKGFATTYLDRHLSEHPGENAEIFTCGPKPMEAVVAQITMKHRVRCQVAYEEYMGCGLGTCMGCVVPCRQGDDWTYKRVCREGPVFLADEMVWEKNQI